MIKRRFYQLEHGDHNDSSDCTSSSSDSELEGEAKEETEVEDYNVSEAKKHDGSCSSSSGYENEDSSGHGVDVDSTGLLTNDDGIGPGIEVENIVQSQSLGKRGTEVRATKPNLVAHDAVPPAVADCVLKYKSVFKCRLCPRIVCLTEETLEAHLKSKRHARSEKLLSEGRLKHILDSDGEIQEIEEEGETHAERHLRIVAAVQNSVGQKNNKGRQRQRKRLKKKKITDSNSEKTRQSIGNPAKRRRKHEK